MKKSVENQSQFWRKNLWRLNFEVTLCWNSLKKITLLQFCEDYHTVLVTAYERHNWLHDKLWIFAMRKCCGLICIHMSRPKLLAPMIMHHELPPPRLYAMYATTMIVLCMPPPWLCCMPPPWLCYVPMLVIVECWHSSQGIYVLWGNHIWSISQNKCLRRYSYHIWTRSYWKT